MRGSVQDAENTPEIGKLDEIFRRVLALFEVPGQTAIAVGERAEGGLDPPPHRQRHEATGRRIAKGDLDINAVTLGRRANGRPGIDAVDLDPLKVPARFGSPRQERRQAVRAMQVGRRDEHGENEAERAGQDMALDAPDLLVAVNTARAFLRTRYDTLRIDDSRRRLRVSLFSGSGVVGASRHQGGNELAEEGFASAPRIVHELEEAEVKRQLPARCHGAAAARSAAATRTLPWC